MITAYDAMWADFDDNTILVIVETALNEPVNVYGPYKGVAEAKKAYDRCSYTGEVGTDYLVFDLEKR